MNKEEINYQVIRTFGPTIFHVKIPKNILDFLNNHTDNLIKNQNEKDKYNHGKDLAGDVTEELFLSKEVLEKSGWLKFLSTCVYKWIEIETGKKITKF